MVFRFAFASCSFILYCCTVHKFSDFAESFSNLRIALYRSRFFFSDSHSPAFCLLNAVSRVSKFRTTSIPVISIDDITRFSNPRSATTYIKNDPTIPKPSSAQLGRYSRNAWSISTKAPRLTFLKYRTLGIGSYTSSSFCCIIRSLAYTIFECPCLEITAHNSEQSNFLICAQSVLKFWSCVSVFSLYWLYRL